MVLLRHLQTPTLEYAIQESAIVEHYFKQGARGLLLVIDQPLPPPPVAAMRIYRKTLLSLDHFEAFAIVSMDALGLGHMVVSNLMMQVLRLTSLSNTLATFTSLPAACTWLSARQDIVLDEVAIARSFTAMSES